MKMNAPRAHYSRTIVLIFLICAACNCQSAQSGDALKLKLNHSALRDFFKYKKDIHGLAIAKGIYLGRTKVNGRKRVGLIIERNNIFWNFNNYGVSIRKRF
jgi:hypothetical protein